MATTSTINHWARSLRKYWAALASVAGFIVGLVGGFLQPVGVSEEERSVLMRFAPTIVTFIAGVMFLLAQKLDKKKHPNWWLVVTLITFVFFIIVFFAYRNYVYTRTCIYDNEIVIIGTSYTPRGLDYLNKNQGVTCQELLDSFIGQSEDVWTRESINESKLLRDFTYSSCVALFAISFLALGQAFYSSEKVKVSKATRGRSGKAPSSAS